MVVSARTGEGLAALAEAVEAALPQWDREVSAVVPYVRGDLVARAHQEGEVLALRHCADGYRADRPGSAGPRRRDRPHCRSRGKLTSGAGTARYVGSWPQPGDNVGIERAVNSAGALSGKAEPASRRTRSAAKRARTSTDGEIIGKDGNFRPAFFVNCLYRDPLVQYRN